MIREQVTPLPLRGDVGVRHRLQPSTQDGLMQILRVAELNFALTRVQPVRRQQTDHRLAASTGPIERLLPPLPRPDPGVRVQIKVDFIEQTRFLFGQPVLDRHRLTAIPAGMAQEHTRHAPPPSAQAFAAAQSCTTTDCRAYTSLRLPNRRDSVETA